MSRRKCTRTYSLPLWARKHNIVMKNNGIIMEVAHEKCLTDNELIGSINDGRGKHTPSKKYSCSGPLAFERGGFRVRFS